MGLLSSPSTKDLSPLLKKFVAKHRVVSVLFYLVGIGWWFCLAYRQFNAGTYFSENALLPGLVHSNYKEDFLVRRYFSALKDEAERYPNNMPHAFLAAQLKQLGLDTFTHNFSLHYPLGDNKVYSGKNVYGILRAARSSSTESLVISVPYRPPNSVFTQTNAGIAIMLSLAASFRKASYWARDIIFLITEHEQLGMEAWLEAYHQTSTGAQVIDYGQLEERAGAIQAALNLEIPTEKMTHIDIRMEGLNGQLPNLDLVNLGHRLFQQERFITTLKEREDPYQPLSFEGWLESVTSLLALMTSQATGVPTGNHGLFHRFGIEAITIAGTQKGRHGLGPLSTGRALEGMIRSLNNLQERFHQSFFFYLMPATNRYISIGVYMPPFGLIVTCLLVQAIAMYISRKDLDQQQQTQWNFLQIGPLLLPAVVAGLLFESAPQYFSYINRWLALDLSIEDAIFAAFCALSLIHCAAFAMLGRCFLKRQQVSTWCIHCAILLLLSTMMFSVAVGNISLAFLTALVIIPAFSIARPVAGRLSNWLRRALFLCVHPLALLVAVATVDTARMFPEQLAASPLAFTAKSLMAAQRALVYSIADATIYGNWLFPLAVSVYFPLWTLAWASLSHLSL